MAVLSGLWPALLGIVLAAWLRGALGRPGVQAGPAQPASAHRLASEMEELNLSLAALKEKLLEAALAMRMDT